MLSKANRLVARDHGNCLALNSVSPNDIAPAGSMSWSTPNPNCRLLVLWPLQKGSVAYLSVGNWTDSSRNWGRPSWSRAWKCAEEPKRSTAVVAAAAAAAAAVAVALAVAVGRQKDK